MTARYEFILYLMELLSWKSSQVSEVDLDNDGLLATECFGGDYVVETWEPHGFKAYVCMLMA